MVDTISQSSHHNNKVCTWHPHILDIPQTEIHRPEWIWISRQECRILLGMDWRSNWLVVGCRDISSWRRKPRPNNLEFIDTIVNWESIPTNLWSAEQTGELQCFAWLLKQRFTLFFLRSKCVQWSAFVFWRIYRSLGRSIYVQILYSSYSHLSGLRSVLQ